jgi:hypothetical protein
MRNNTLDILEEDFEDFLADVENSFNIKFDTNQLNGVRKIDELTHLITSKMTVEFTNDCTAQQAFYKLRTAILLDNNWASTWTPKTSLIEIFPKETRKQQIKHLKKRLGIKLDILRPKIWIQMALFISFILSIILCFFNATLGFLACFLSVSLLVIAFKIGNELSVTTLGALSENLVTFNYIKSRRNPLTANLEEVKSKTIALFVERFGFDKEEVRPNSVFRFN